MSHSRLIPSLVRTTSLLMVFTLVGCSSERVRDEAELLDYLKSVAAEERDHFEQVNGSAAGAPAATAEASPTNQFFPAEEGRNR